MKPVIYDRHAKRRMKERQVSEDEVAMAIQAPDSAEPDIKGRTNFCKYQNNRYVRVTAKDESGHILVITVTIRIKPFVR